MERKVWQISFSKGKKNSHNPDRCFQHANSVSCVGKKSDSSFRVNKQADAEVHSTAPHDDKP